MLITEALRAAWEKGAQHGSRHPLGGDDMRDVRDSECKETFLLMAKETHNDLKKEAP